jgi:ABC-type nickel/cobalt efflux system permease component RcnA
VRLGRCLAAIGALAPAALAVAAAFTLAKQWRGDYRNFEWPQVTDAMHVVGIVAVLALAAVAVVSAWRDERSTGHGAPGPAAEPDPDPGPTR